jgi:lipoate-protein ligase A
VKDNNYFRLIISKDNNGFMNMAIDEAIAISCRKKLSPPALRLYTWSPPCISIGYFQDIKEVNIQECKRQKIDIVRRLTGGKAVLHNKEITYSIISPVKSPIFPADIKGSYKKIAQGLLLGLKNMGISAEIAEDRAKELHRFSCFLNTSFYEITVKGKKLIGSAQKRWKDIFLQHGSIIISSPYSLLSDLINFKDQEEKRDFLRLHAEKGTSISEELKRNASEGEIIDAIKKGLEDGIGIRLKKDRLTKEEKIDAHRLFTEKYNTRRWNYNHLP